ncbi:MAG TPA: DsbA family protein [Nocardioides sp.]|nr:DsbA family protein [Nocardioides sp.]
MDVDLYSDPSCPWCWTASQWLYAAAADRDLTVHLRLFSVALLDKPAPPPVVLARAWSLRAMRVATALDSGPAAAFLGEFSRLLFSGEAGADGPDLGKALARAGKPRELADGADEAWRDEQIEASMRAAAEHRGLPLDRTTTVPIVVLHTDAGPVAIDGPLLDPAPAPARAAAFWDAFLLLAQEPGMYGVTRPRRGPHSTLAALTGAALIEGRMS